LEIIANNITVRQGGFELRDVSFSLSHNENLAITGVSGSGKSMLARALCGQLFVKGDLKISFSADKGLLRGNREMKDSTDAGLLPQAVYVGQHYTIKNRNNLIDGYYQQRYNSADNENSYTVWEELKIVSDDEQKIDFFLNELSIAYLKNKPLLQFSSGEHKRFQLVKALLNPVQLLVLDEPFAGLDVAGRKKLDEILSDLSNAGTMLILILNACQYFPDCITHVLALERGRQRQFLAKENFSIIPPLVAQTFNDALMPAQSEGSTDLLGVIQAIIRKSNLLFSNELNFENAILMKNVTVKYGCKIVLDNINWQVRKGERWLLKGKNGAGKSILMSLVAADNPQAYANEIYLFDKRRGSGESIWDVKQNIGYVSPELCTFFDRHISCFDAVASGYFDTMSAYHKLTGEQTNHIHDWLQVLHVEDLAHKRLSDISSGMQRLILLIRAFIKNPPLLILDEPCQGLDDYQTRVFVKLVEAICSQIETTMVYITHYENEAPSCVSQVLELDEGRIKHVIP